MSSSTTNVEIYINLELWRYIATKSYKSHSPASKLSLESSRLVTTSMLLVDRLMFSIARKSIGTFLTRHSEFLSVDSS